MSIVLCSQHYSVGTNKDPLALDQTVIEHFKKNKKPQPPKYVCECGKSFKRNQSLNTHRNFSCGKVKLFQCKFCYCNFLTKHQLTLHGERCKNKLNKLQQQSST